MIDFTHWEQPGEASAIVGCDSCGWNGQRHETQHLAGEPICPVCKAAALVIYEPGDETPFDA